jgi:hypothetical protein
MILIWRGWGILTFFMPFIWLFILIGIAIGMDYHQADPDQANAEVARMFALALALSAVSLYIIWRYRERVAPGVDHLIYIPTKYWNWLFAAGAVVLFVLSFFPKVFA